MRAIIIKTDHLLKRNPHAVRCKKSTVLPLRSPLRESAPCSRAPYIWVALKYAHAACCPRAVRCERVPRAHAHRASGWRSSTGMHTPLVALAQSAARECPVLARTVHLGSARLCTRRLLPLRSPQLRECSVFSDITKIVKQAKSVMYMVVYIHIHMLMVFVIFCSLVCFMYIYIWCRIFN